MIDPAAALVHIIGVGNELRGDDGVGLEAVRRIRTALPGAPPEPIAVSARCGDPVGLIDIWSRTPAVVLVDAMRSGGRPGTIRRFDGGRDPLPVAPRRSGAGIDRLPVAFGAVASTHAGGLEAAIELARVLGRLPPRLIVYGVEGRSFEPGMAVSDPVRAALASVVRQVVAEARRLVLTAAGVPSGDAQAAGRHPGQPHMAQLTHGVAAHLEGQAVLQNHHPVPPRPSDLRDDAQQPPAVGHIAARDEPA